MVSLSSSLAGVVQNATTPSAERPGTAGAEYPFAGVLKGALEQMGDLEKDAAGKVDGLLHGTGVDVHAAMISTERANLAFELALAVRGKAVAAYEQLNSMQF